MQLYYEGKDITNSIEIRKADITDNAGEELDSLDLILNDTKGLWSAWGPEKNNSVQIKAEGFDSGIMYIDEISQQRGSIIIRALPIKQEAKTPYNKAWDNVRFMEFCQDIAKKQSLELKTYGIENYLYPRVDQHEQADLRFLAWRSLLEGYTLKVTNGSIVIFSEKYMENQDPIKILTPDDIDGDFFFKDKSSNIFGSCKIINKEYPYQFTDPKLFGAVLKYYDISVNSLGESERYSKGLLRAKNKFEKTLGCNIKFSSGIAAGNMITAANFGIANGKYFIYQIIHRLVENKSTLRLRKPLEGY